MGTLEKTVSMLIVSVENVRRWSGDVVKESSSVHADIMTVAANANKNLLTEYFIKYINDYYSELLYFLSIIALLHSMQSLTPSFCFMRLGLCLSAKSYMESLQTIYFLQPEAGICI